MNNLTSAQEAFKKIRRSTGQKRVTIMIEGCDETMDDLEAVGIEDLRAYFVPEGLKLRPGDAVTVNFSYGVPQKDPTVIKFCRKCGMKESAYLDKSTNGFGGKSCLSSGKFDHDFSDNATQLNMGGIQMPIGQIQSSPPRYGKLHPPLDF